MECKDLFLTLCTCLTSQDQATLKLQEKEIDKNKANFAKLEQKYKDDLEGVTAAQKHFQAVSAGLSSSDDGEDATLADQLMGKL